MARLRKKKLGLGAIILLLIGAVLLGLWQAQSQSAEGTITPPSTAIQQTAPTPRNFRGKQISFSYRSNYQARQVTPNKNYIEEYLFISSPKAQVATASLALSVWAPQNGGLASDSDYVVRQKQPSVYAQRADAVAAEPVTIFTRQTAGYEKSAFWVHNGLVLNITLSSANQITPSPELDAQFDQVLKSIHWL